MVAYADMGLIDFSKVNGFKRSELCLNLVLNFQAGNVTDWRNELEFGVLRYKV